MLLIPKKSRGRQSAKSDEKFKSSLDSFYAELKEINETIPFKVSSRGWCYLLEEYGLMKGDFDSAEKLINDGRKNGGLPIDFTALDSSRAFSCIEFVDDSTPEGEADYIIGRASKLIIITTQFQFGVTKNIIWN